MSLDAKWVCELMDCDYKLFSGTSNTELSRAIAQALGINLSKADIRRFSDGEIFVEIQENVRGVACFIIQPTSFPVNDSLMELLIIVDALKRSSARSITTVIPYYGYARQDRKTQSRVPITAKLVADLLEAAGVTRVISIDLHAGQIQGFFNIPFDHLYAKPVICDYIKTHYDCSNLCVVSPDAGGVERARAYAKRLGATLAIIDKRRVKPNEAEALHLVGEVEGMDTILVDDIIDTAGTLVQAIYTLLNNGAKSVSAAATHGVFSGAAYERLKTSPVKEVICTDTIVLPPLMKGLVKITRLSVGKMLAETIRRIQSGESVSALFE